MTPESEAWLQRMLSRYPNERLLRVYEVAEHNRSRLQAIWAESLRARRHEARSAARLSEAKEHVRLLRDETLRRLRHESQQDPCQVCGSCGGSGWRWCLGIGDSPWIVDDFTAVCAGYHDLWVT